RPAGACGTGLPRRPRRWPTRSRAILPNTRQTGTCCNVSGSPTLIRREPPRCPWNERSTARRPGTRRGGTCRGASGEGDVPMRVGIVCPYSWDIPGGVQAHVRDLAAALIGLGHRVSVLAPGDEDTTGDIPVPPHVVTAGRAVPVRYNGSVARLQFGPVSAARVRRGPGEGRVDRLHVHRPAAPGPSPLARILAPGAVAGT